MSAPGQCSAFSPAGVWTLRTTDAQTPYFRYAPQSDAATKPWTWPSRWRLGPRPAKAASAIRIQEAESLISQRRPWDLITIGGLMILFGFAEVVTSFTSRVLWHHDDPRDHLNVGRRADRHAIRRGRCVVPIHEEVGCDIGDWVLDR